MKSTSVAVACGLALSGLVSDLALAHPGWVTGTSNLSLINRVPATTVNPATGAVTTASSPTAASSPSRGYLEDGVRISHGCSDAAGGYGNGSAVRAVSWVWPTGQNPADPAPMSIGCDATGAKCTGVATQPSVATIPNAGQKANYNNAPWPAGAATQASLGDHLCTDASCNARVNSLAGMLTPQGNQGYFRQFKAKPGNNGFWAEGKKMSNAQIAAFSPNWGVPYASNVQISYVTNVATPTATMVFSPSSCARKLVVRPAGADICKVKNRKVYRGHEHDQNFWFGGPTAKFVDGHGVNENFWMGYNLLVRNTTTNPYPAQCQDKVYGDYDLVVMPSINEIDKGLPFPGWGKPASD